MFDEWIRIAFALNSSFSTEQGWMLFQQHSAIYEEPSVHPEWKKTWEGITKKPKPKKLLTMKTLAAIAQATHPELFYALVRVKDSKELAVVVWNTSNTRALWHGLPERWSWAKSGLKLSPNCAAYVDELFEQLEQTGEVPHDFDVGKCFVFVNLTD